MKIKPFQPQVQSLNKTPQTSKASENKGSGLVDAVQDFFQYTSRDSDPHETFVGRLGLDFKHAAPFAAKLGGTGAAIGLAAGLAVGGAVLLPLVGGVGGVMAATLIADKADNARDMKELAAIAGWNS